MIRFFVLYRKHKTKGSDFHEIRLRGAIKHLARHDRRNCQVVRNIENLITQITRMRSAQFAIAFDVPFLQKIRQSLIAIFNLSITRNTAEDLAILFVRWIANLDLMAKTPQKCFIHQVSWGKVARENDQHIERHLDFSSGMEAQKVYTVFER